MRQKARIITIAWGGSYVDQLLELTLPAVLAPGNLPAIASILDCEFVLVTESKFFDRIRNSSIFRCLQDTCSVRLVKLDDLIRNEAGYGLLLTLAFHRGFSDLGENMKEYFLIFFNADFIIGNGSFETLGQRINSGEKLIFSPSYCVVLEEVSSILSDQVDAETGRLTISRRDMAALILAHRHPTIKGKTVNQRLFHMPYIEQFYWHVDDQTLLGHQLPVSLVCMMPQRVLTKMRTLWDYGIISEACPTTKPCVLGDSDEFLMMELRRQNVARDQLELGWPSAEHIANKLSMFVTKDHLDMGLYPLVLHSGEIPESVHSAKEQLREYVQGVYQHLPTKPLDHLNHPIWNHHSRLLPEMRGQHERVPTEHAQEGSQQGLAPEIKKDVFALFSQFKQSLLGFLEQRYRAIVGRPPFVNRLHPFHSILTPTLELLKSALSKPKRKILLFGFDAGYISMFLRSHAQAGHLITDGSLEFVKEGRIAVRVSSQREQSDLEENKAGLKSLHGVFDLCVCEVNLPEFLEFRKVLQVLIPLMRAGGRIVVFFHNHNMVHLKSLQHMIIERSTASVGESQMFFSGSVWTWWALKLHDFGATLRSRYGLWGSLALVGLVIFAIPLSFIGNRASQRYGQNTMPKNCLSLTMDYRVP